MPVHLAACLSATFLLLFGFASALAGPKPIALQVRPLVSFAPSTLQIRVRVLPHETDRWISVAMDGEHFYRESGWTIEGDRTLYSYELKDVPQGDYEVFAAIGHNETVRASDRVHVVVQGWGHDLSESGVQ